MEMDYVAVIRDFRNGTLDRSNITICIDDDGGYWLSGADDDEAAEQLEEKYGSPGGGQDIVAILNAAGVPAEWV